MKQIQSTYSIFILDCTINLWKKDSGWILQLALSNMYAQIVHNKMFPLWHYKPLPIFLWLKCIFCTHKKGVHPIPMTLLVEYSTIEYPLNKYWEAGRKKHTFSIQTYIVQSARHKKRSEIYSSLSLSSIFGLVPRLTLTTMKQIIHGSQVFIGSPPR